MTTTRLIDQQPRAQAPCPPWCELPPEHPYDDMPYDHDGSESRYHSIDLGGVHGRDGQIHVEVDTVGITVGTDPGREQFMYPPRAFLSTDQGDGIDIGDEAAARELAHLLIDAARRLRLIEQAGYEIRP